MLADLSLTNFRKLSVAKWEILEHTVPQVSVHSPIYQKCSTIVYSCSVDPRKMRVGVKNTIYTVYYYSKLIYTSHLKVKENQTFIIAIIVE